MSLISKGYKLPDIIDPGSVRCIRVYVPDDPLYIAAFWGAYEFFTSWLAWERDSEHRGLAAASVWKEAFNQSREEYLCNEGGCGIMDVRQNIGSACQLEKKIACSDWEAFADLRLCVPKMRFLNGVLQQDTTGSGDWVDAGDPEEPYDDRNSGAYIPAWVDPPPGQDGACLAALNAIAFSRGIVSAYANLIDGGANLITSTLYWFSSIQVIAAVSAIIIEATVTLQALMNGFAGDWTDVAGYDYTDDILCIIKSAYSTNGSMMGEDWAAIGSELEAEALTHSNEFEKTAIRLSSIVFFALGPVGMSRVANFAGIVAGDCEVCAWYRSIDFTSSDGDFDTDLYGLGEWSSAGWGYSDVSQGSTDRRGVRVQRTFTQFSATKIAITYDYVKGSWNPATSDAVLIRGSGDLLSVHSDDVVDGSGLVAIWEGTGDITTLLIQALSSYNTSSQGFSGSCRITKLELWGVGIPPF